MPAKRRPAEPALSVASAPPVRPKPRSGASVASAPLTERSAKRGASAAPVGAAKKAKREKEVDDEEANAPQNMTVKASAVGEDCSCDVCEASSKDVAWAAVQMVTTAGVAKEVAVGSACADCYKIGIGVLMYPGWKPFVKAYNSSEVVQQNCQKILLKFRASPDVREQWMGADEGEGSVGSSSCLEICAEMKFRGYSEGSMRRAMQATRLTQKAMKDVPQVSVVPPLKADGVQENFFLFNHEKEYDSKDDGLDIWVRSKKTIDLSHTQLAPRNVLYDRHVQDAFSRACASSPDQHALALAAAGKTQSYDDFLENYTGHVRRPPAGSGLVPARGKPVVEVGAISGPAAAELEVLPEAEQSVPIDLNIDLSNELVRQKQATPRKKKESGDNDAMTIDGEEDEEEIEDEDCVDGNWLSHWRTRFPLRSAMVGKPKGRTEAALRKRVVLLLGNKDTRPQGIDLEVYHKNVKRAMLWRNSNAILTMEDTEVEADLEMYKKNGVILPAQQCQALVSRKSTKLRERHEHLSYYAVVKPFVEAATEFDPFNPTLAALPRLELWKLQCFLTVVFDDNLTHLFLAGADSLDTIKKQSSAVLTMCEETDAVSISAEAGVFLAELTDTFSGVWTICALPFSSNGEDAVKSLLSEKLTKESVGPLSKIRPVISKASWFKERGEKFLNALVTIAEKEHDIQNHIENVRGFLDQSDGHQEECWTSDLGDMCKDLAAIASSVEIPCLDEFSANLMRALILHVDGVLNVARQSGLSKTWWDALGILLCEASVAFPLETKIPDWQLDAKQLREEVAMQGIIMEFRESLNTFMAARELQEETCNTLAAIANKSAGVKLDKDVVRMVASCIEKLVDCIASHNFVGCSAVAVKCARELMRFSPEESKSFGILLNGAESGVKLQEYQEFLAGALRDDLLLPCRKAIVDLEACLKLVLAIKVESHALLVKAMSSAMDDLHKTYSKKNKEALDHELAMKKVAMNEVVMKMRVTAYGSVDQISWSAGLSPKADITAVLEQAKTKTIMTLDMGQHDELMQELERAIDSTKAVHDMLGSNVQIDKELKDAETLHLRSLVTSVERQLLDAASGDKDSARVAVQQAIRRVRDKNHKEKEVLSSAVYRWAYSALTAR